MNLFIFFTFLFFSLFSNASNLIELRMKNGEIYKGEFIDFYEDRWFYEPDSTDVKKYILLFEDTSKLGPQFYFKDLTKVLDMKVLPGGRESAYSKLLIKRQISLDYELVHQQHVLLGNEGYHKYEKMFGNFAWDIGVLGKNGRSFKNSGLLLGDYYVYSKEVRSPLSGVVVGKVNSEEDNPPDPSFKTNLKGKVNNHLTLQLDDLFYLSLVHFKKNSIRLSIGDSVEEGQVVGQVGNSGVSYLPHLHYTLYVYIEGINRFISVPGIPEQ
jgi:hypothetical protein